jgi:hypothetical protein
LNSTVPTPAAFNLLKEPPFAPRRDVIVLSATFFLNSTMNDAANPFGALVLIEHDKVETAALDLSFLPLLLGIALTGETAKDPTIATATPIAIKI